MHIVYATNSPRFSEFYLTDKREAVPQDATVLAICTGKRTIENQDEDLFNTMTDEDYFTIRRMVAEAERLERDDRPATLNPAHPPLRRFLSWLLKLLRPESANAKPALAGRDQRQSRINKLEEEKTMSYKMKSDAQRLNPGSYRQLGSQLRLLLLFAVCLFACATVARAATFHVTTAADNGSNTNPTAGSLRKAIIDANNTAGADTIDFNIPGAGVHKISLVTGLPEITAPVTIDGYTQPGASANTLAGGDNAVLLIELTGTNAFNFSGSNGLTISAGSSTIKGLIINGFAGSGNYSASGIVLRSKGGNVIAGNFIGTDSSGTSKIPNGDGVYIEECSGNTIGGPAAARNVISGNKGFGVFINGDGATDNFLIGNFIGTDRNGTAKLGNKGGINIQHIGPVDSDIKIGGTSPGNGNVISGNATAGIFSGGEMHRVLIQGNLIGTDVTGTKALGNGDEGIEVATANANSFVIGGQTAAARNIISANGGNGIFIESSADAVIIRANYIGTDVTGKVALGNGRDGVFINSNFNDVGGATQAEGNVISANGSAGIALYNGTTGNNVNFNLIGCGANLTTPLGNDSDGIRISDGSNNYIGSPSTPNVIAFNQVGIWINQGTGNLMSANSLIANHQFGLDLSANGGDSGPTFNDLGDADTGANNLQNYPVLTRASLINNGLTYVSGTLNSTPNTKFHIELFANTAPAHQGYGEGQLYIGGFDVTTDASGNASFTSGGWTGLSLGQYISATATDPAYNTSEFSLNRQVAADGPGHLQFGVATYYVGESDGQGFINVERTGGSFGTVSVQYATVAGGSATAGSDYTPQSGTLTWGDGDDDNKTIPISILNDSLSETDETISLALSNPTNGASLGTPNTAVLSIHDDDGSGAATIQFYTDGYTVQEGLTARTITVTRTGDTSAQATVDYATSDGSASQTGDYELTSGTLTFAPGETTKSFNVLINEDSYVEGSETVNLTLSHPTGAVLGQQTDALLIILDDGVEQTTNPNDEAQAFVYQQYHDFLNREPDAGGLDYWTQQLTQCGNDQTCINQNRRDVAAAFYIENEFQTTGSFIYRMQKASLGAQPTYQQFMADRSRVAAGVNLSQSKQSFAAAFVQRPSFLQKYPAALSADEFVNKLYDMADLKPYAQERQQQVQAMQNGKSRADVLQDVIEMPEFKQREYNPCFILMQYFGFLRRDADQGGYDFWLNVLNTQVPNDASGYHAVVCAFITSAEYQDRFSFMHTHSNTECGP